MPSAIEWMLRYLKVSDIDFGSFQEKYDLKEKNSFGLIAKLVMQDYPQVRIKDRPFKYGREKIDFIKDLIGKGIPVLIVYLQTFLDTSALFKFAT